MTPPRPPFRISRRHFLGFVGFGAVAAALVLPRRRAFAGEGTGHPYTETPADDEGPFYREGSPARADLRVADSKKPPLAISGVVRDEDGKYRFDTNFPGQYSDAQGRKRPIHIHCKLSGEGLYALTTQMYFKVRAGVDVPSELVPDVTWSGEDAAKKGTGTWNVFLARRSKD